MNDRSFFALTPVANDPAEDTCTCEKVSPEQEAIWRAHYDALVDILFTALDGYGETHPDVPLHIEQMAAGCLVSYLHQCAVEEDCDA